MPVTVYLPSMLRPYASGAEALTVTQPVHTIAELVAALWRQAPRVAAELEDSLFTFVVNGEMPLHGGWQHPVRDGDRVGIVRLFDS